MAMGAGFVTVTICLIISRNVDSFFPGMLVNLVVMLGSHYLLKEKGGWQPLDPASPLALERLARKKVWKRRWNTIKTLRLSTYLQQNLPAHEGFYAFFGLYTVAAIYIAFYFMDSRTANTYKTLYTGIYHTVLPVTTALLTFSLWPTRVKKSKFMVYFWPLSVGGLLFFVGFLLTIMSDFHHVQMMILMINLLIAVLLLQWPLALFLAFLGTLGAVFFFTWQTDTVFSLQKLELLQFRTTYGLLLFTSLLIVLFRSKAAYRQLAKSYEQLKVDKKASKKTFVEALHHKEVLLQGIQMDKLDALHTIKQMQQQLNDDLNDAQTKEQLDHFKKKLQTTSEKLDRLVDHVSQVLQQTQNYMRVEVDTVALSELLDNVFSVVMQQEGTLMQQILTYQKSTHRILQVDVPKIKKLFVEGLYYAWRHKQATVPVLLNIDDTLLGYPITSIKNYVKKVQALRIVITTAKTVPEKKKLYMGSMDKGTIRLPKASDDLPITENQQIVDAHYGVSALLENEQGITQIYVVPVRVREVRPQVMDLPHNTTVEVSDTIDPTEEALVEKVQQIGMINMSLFQKAIQLTKQYHAGVTRKSGEPFYLHPIAVASILLDYTQDQDTLLAALLHDIVEDTKFPLARVALHFNTDVSKIVDGVTRLDNRLKSFKRIQLSMDENIRQLLAIKDERILYVKLADRLHNMRTIRAKSPMSQQKTARETLLFYVPIAEKLDLAGIAEELRRLCDAVLHNPDQVV